jgi:MoaA/NifB/PqqE/SkfB family radical SAM enzyme
MNISSIQSLELELTSRCNAACPQCPRITEHDFKKELDHNREITVENLKDWLPKELLDNLNKIIFKGTFSDPLISKHFVDIVEWFKVNSKSAKILIHTNGSLRNKDFWKWLALSLPTSSEVIFAIDGLEDTHSLYRINTDYNKIINNAKIFIENGGQAVWQFIIFKHNEHQIIQAKNLSEELGFKRFFTMHSDRAFDNDSTKNYNSVKSLTKNIERKNIIENITEKNVICKSLEKKEIFINWDGEVFPCCMTSIFSTKAKNYFDFVLWKKHILQNDFTNNSLQHHTLNEILQFFNKFYATIEQEPKLRVCAKYCGIKKLT